MSRNKSDLCRVCMVDDSKNNIFRTIAAGDLIANLLIDLADIEVDIEDPLPMPNNVCDTCLDAVTQAFTLRKQIRSSDTLLRDMYANVRLPQIEEVDDVYDSDIKQDVAHTTVGMNDTELYNMVVEVVDEFNNPLPPGSGGEDEEFAEWLDPQPSVPPPEKEEVVETDRLNCCTCPETFETLDEVRQHLLDVHGKQHDPTETRASFLKHVVPCTLCGRKFDTENQMKKHKFQYKTMMTCPTCGTLVRTCSMRDHMMRHSNVLVECNVCHKSYKKSYISEHKAKVHCQVRRFQCEYCEKAFTTKMILKTHFRRRHDPNGQKIVKAICSVCNKTFESKSAHREHMFIHTGHKRFQCEHCDASFMHSTDFKRHTWTHIGSPFSCKKCNKYMDRPSHLRAHETAGCNGTNFGTRQRRSYKYRKAAAASSSDESLSEEEEEEEEEIDAIQTESAGILSYSCGKCYEQFSSESEFAMHMTTTHGGKGIY